MGILTTVDGLIRKYGPDYFRRNTRTFLLWGGILLLLHGTRGLLDPTISAGADLEIYFLPAANYTYAFLGVIGILASIWAGSKIQTGLTLLLGLTGFLIATTKFLVLGTPELSYSGLIDVEFIDVLIHLGTGFWALLVVWGE